VRDGGGNILGCHDNRNTHAIRLPFDRTHGFEPGPAANGCGIPALNREETIVMSKGFRDGALHTHFFSYAG
jgi:hypothetical protein